MNPLTHYELFRMACDSAAGNNVTFDLAPDQSFITLEDGVLATLYFNPGGDLISLEVECDLDYDAGYDKGFDDAMRAEGNNG